MWDAEGCCRGCILYNGCRAVELYTAVEVVEVGTHCVRCRGLYSSHFAVEFAVERWSQAQREMVSRATLGFPVRHMQGLERLLIVLHDQY